MEQKLLLHGIYSLTKTDVFENAYVIPLKQISKD